MRTIISFLELKDSELSNKLIKLPDNAINVSPDDKEMNFALTQLRRKRIISIKEDGTYIIPSEFLPLFKYYSIIKAFDHTIIYE